MWPAHVISQRQYRRLNLIVALVILHGCATGPSRLYQDGGHGAPPGALRLVEVVELAAKAYISTDPAIYKPLAAAGIKDATSREGSIGAGRVYCCGGLMDETYVNFFYIPSDIQTEPGDIVEIKCGSAPEGHKSSVNTVLRVVQRKNDATGTCRWIPPEKRLGRILYCDWMPQQGWVKHQGTFFEDMWIKPAPP